MSTKTIWVNDGRFPRSGSVRPEESNGFELFQSNFTCHTRHQDWCFSADLSKLIQHVEGWEEWNFNLEKFPGQEHSGGVYEGVTSVVPRNLLTFSQREVGLKLLAPPSTTNTGGLCNWAVTRFIFQPATSWLWLFRLPGSRTFHHFLF